MKRILKVNYRKNNMQKLSNWLTANNFKYEIVRDCDQCNETDDGVVIGTVILALILYSDEAEVATRLQWNIESD
jgi:hypothetical protein